MPLQRTSIQLPESVVERLDRIAEAEGTSRSDVIRDTITMALDAREEFGGPKMPKLQLPE